MLIETHGWISVEDEDDGCPLPDRARDEKLAAMKEHVVETRWLDGRLDCFGMNGSTVVTLDASLDTDAGEDDKLFSLLDYILKRFPLSSGIVHCWGVLAGEVDVTTRRIIVLRDAKIENHRDPFLALDRVPVPEPGRGQVGKKTERRSGE